MKLVKRLIMWLAVAVSLAAVAAAGAAAHAQAKPVTVTLAGWSSSPAEDALLQQMLATFEKTHPGIKVEYSVINGDYPTAMLARFAAHNPPDVFYVDSSVAPEWAKQGVLQPLNRFAAKTTFDTKAFYPRLLEAFRVGRTIYGLPKDWSPLAMEINTGILGNVHAKPAKTWAQLEAVARKIQSSGLLNGGKAICLSPDWARLLAFVYQNGGSLADVRSPAVRKAVQFYVGLKQKGLAATPADLGVDWCGEALGKQKAAIIFEGNWLLPYMHQTFPNVRYGVFPMVRGKQPGNLAFTVAYAMAKDAKNKPAAWTLLSWLTGRQGEKLWVSKGLALPSRSDVKPLGGRQAFLSQAPYAHPWGFAGFSDVYTVMNNDLTAVMSGSKSIPQMLADVASALKQAGER
ncbi:MAG: extracellular solute-binding protein [Gaiellaceae bacterium]